MDQKLKLKHIKLLKKLGYKIEQMSQEEQSEVALGHNCHRAYVHVFSEQNTSGRE
jgi:hypothetical protein